MILGAYYPHGGTAHVPPSMQTAETTIRRADHSIQVKYPLMSLPLYLVERLTELVKT